MAQEDLEETREVPLIELNDELALPDGVRFDPANVRLRGRYVDELSAYRAKRVWREVLESNFLLEQQQDFQLFVSEGSEDAFYLQCDFLTACARYAFWRLTNDQAPEAQYLIETAHIPESESLHDSFVSAPDLTEEPYALSGIAHQAQRTSTLLARWLRTVLRRR